jgi:threonylcarbamoyladenosine tRNA methylthiotransferase MtaB
MRVAFTTLGCRLNQFETQAMAHRVRRGSTRGDVVSWDQDAEIYVINSCTVTARAEQKCRQLARSAKRQRPGAKVVVVGCYSQLGRDRLQQMGEVDAILGNEEKRRLDEYLTQILEGPGRLTAVGRLSPQLPMAAEWIDDFGGLARPTIKVQEGCNMRCRFCAIWKARGRSRSRPPRDVVEQAKHLADAGFHELVLGGVHLGHYGRDLEPATDLHALLEMLLENTPVSLRFRLSSIDPSEVDRRLVRLLAAEPRLCRYLHLPLQSGSNDILRSMRRAYGVEYYEALVNDIVSLDPAFGLGVDLIVGYPGEGERQFEEGLALLERLPLSFYHVFRYSDRPGTASSQLPDKVPGRVAQERSQRLRELGRRKREQFLGGLVGQRLDGIVESSTDEEGRAEIMADNYASVWASLCASAGGSAVSDRTVVERSRVRVEVVEKSAGRLLGEIVLGAKAMV